jgi:glycosyltransferase involved in cell wall biosynthesis
VNDGWIVLGQTTRLRWGGDIRRHYLLKPLARVVGTELGPNWTADVLRSSIDKTHGERPRLASAELLDSEALAIAREQTQPVVVDLHDEPLAHASALGHALTTDRATELAAMVEENVDAFRYLIAQSPEFVRLVGLDPARTIIAPSGTDTKRIVPGPWPDHPVVGLVSGASPGRGIETLIDACRRLRADVPTLRLWLAIVGTTDDGRAYVENLREAVTDEPWIELETVPYHQLGPRLAAIRVLVVPHPAHPYWDAVLPIKLFDYLASGRPVVATPRAATAALLERHGAGLITAGDRCDDLADGILKLLEDDALSRRLGLAARVAAESTYDWAIIGRRLAEDVIRRADRRRWLLRRFAIARNRILGREGRR